MEDLEKEIFEQRQKSGDELFDIDGENLITIDLSDIDDSSIKDARDMINNLSQFYYDEEFIKSHPTIKKRIDSELESMRVLIKMRKADERAHDAILQAISTNNNNASLYRALTEIQKTIISITTKMGEIVTSLNNMMKGFQLEMNFDKNNDEEIEVNQNTHRGSKDFIKSMLKESEED